MTAPVRLSSALPDLPAQPADTPWPTAAWPRGEIGSDVDGARLAGLYERAFAQPSDLGETYALLCFHRGRLVQEQYVAGYGPETTFHSWSMAKSILQGLVGVLVKRGWLDIHAPADMPEWRAPGDERAAITLDQLLRMSSGLEFCEEYSPDKDSSTVEMLFGPGRPDTAHYAASKPLIHAPDSVCYYSSGTSNIVAAVVKRTLEAHGEDTLAFMQRELFAPIGIRSAIPKFDAAGTWIGSSYCFCTAEDFARFGLLYLRGGSWDGREIVSRDWVDYARTPTPVQPEDEALGYGAHFWLGLGGPGSFSMNGYQGQFTIMVPGSDLIIVRTGKSEEQKDAVRGFLTELAGCFR